MLAFAARLVVRHKRYIWGGWSLANNRRDLVGGCAGFSLCKTGFFRFCRKAAAWPKQGIFRRRRSRRLLGEPQRKMVRRGGDLPNLPCRLGRSVFTSDTEWAYEFGKESRMKLLRVAVCVSLAACAAGPALAQYGLYGAPDMLQLQPTPTSAANGVAPSAYQAEQGPMVSSAFAPGPVDPTAPMPAARLCRPSPAANRDRTRRAAVPVVPTTDPGYSLLLLAQLPAALRPDVRRRRLRRPERNGRAAWRAVAATIGPPASGTPRSWGWP